MNEPQLSEKLNRKFHDLFFPYDETFVFPDDPERIKHFLATALEEQKQKVLDEVDEQLRQFQLIYGSFNSSTGDLMGYRISEHEESADVLIRYLRIKLNQLKGSDDQPVRNA